MFVNKKTGEVTYSPSEKKQMRVEKLRLDKVADDRSVARSNYKFIFNFLYISFCLLLIVALFRTAQGQDPITFTGLLQCLENVPNVTLNTFSDLTITAEWGVFNFFRDFLNIFTSAFSVTIFISSLLIQLILFIAYVVAYFFGFVA